MMDRRNPHFIKSIILGLAVTLMAPFFSGIAYCCTRVLVADEGQAVMVGRNMDWDLDIKTNLWVYPRGIPHQGLETVNPLIWTSKYGSLVATGYERIVTDGINEQGLSAHMLWLAESDYGKRNPDLPGLPAIFWAQFYLDNFATVDEAVRFTKKIPYQVTPYFDRETNRGVKIHLALDDARGDSAIIEYINGQLQIYHDRSYNTLTNSPSYDKQLENLKLYQGFGGDKPLPGTTLPKDRFVRAAYYSSHLPKASSVRDELTKVLHIIENVSQPEGIVTPERKTVVPTIWRIIADLTHRTYYFNASTRLNIIWVQLDKFNLTKDAPVMKLDLVNGQDLVGDVSNQFHPAKLPPLLSKA